MPATIEIDEANGAIKKSGSATATTASKLVDAGGGFNAAVDVGDEVYNSTDLTHAYVTAKDSDTTLSLSADIFVNGEGYQIQGEFTHNIANSNMGSVDAQALDPVAYPVVPAANTYEKYQKLHVTAIGTSSKIDNLKVWRTGALGVGGTHSHLTNARIAAYARKPYAAPVATASTPATQAMPSSVPATANLGIDGSLAGSILAVGFDANKAFSDFLIHQIQTDASATAGSTSVMNFQYDETA